MDLVALIAAWKQPERAADLLGYRKRAVPLSQAPPRDALARLQAADVAQDARMTKWGEKRYGRQWNSLPPRFREFLSREWTDDEPPDPQTGTG
ncbi:MAG: hypothetical protein R2729_28125 [Bryobacteraceae bacterium]